MNFLGNIDVKADNKGRLFVPAQYRKQLERENESSLVMRINRVLRCAEFFPMSVWEEMDKEFKSKLNMWDAKDKMLYRQFISQVEVMEMDASGRILLKKEHCETIGITTDARFVGVSDHFEVWNGDSLDQSLYSPEEFEKLMQEKMGNTTVQ
ncbi:MAG: cell division/cell wall cluster transcriptional repressor MraZ [Paludibacteraceae bacterium]|nr:cell division/cell wall cluster transcriptional repressor MraZ [Paludibacteraceae bacterium]